MPMTPLPLQRGQSLKPTRSARVVGALGLARKGTSRGTLPIPLHKGHLEMMDIF
jgi:hypothetical protein